MKYMIVPAATFMLLAMPTLAADADEANCRIHMQYFRMRVHSLAEMDTTGGTQAVVSAAEGDLGKIEEDAECRLACEKNIQKNRPALDAHYKDLYANDKVHNAFGDRLASLRLFCTNGPAKTSTLFDRFEDLK